MDLIVKTATEAAWGSQFFRCSIGSKGIVSADRKKEGDLQTPAGRWTMREVFYREDRVARPETILPVKSLEPQDGWCDAPEDMRYNQFVQHPYPASAEHLWREDHLYDVVVVLGYNDRPIAPGHGSAIFLHVARPDWGPSTGCIHLQLSDLLVVLRQADFNSCVDVKLSF